MNKDLSYQINNALLRIDNIVINEYVNEPNGLLHGLGGCSLYFANRYLNTKNSNFYNYSLSALDRIIVKTNSVSPSPFPTIGIPISTCCWVVSQLIEYGLLEESDRVNATPIVELIIRPTSKEDLSRKGLDLFYGFIGRAQILIEYDQEIAKPFVLSIIDVIQNLATKDSNGVYWVTLTKDIQTNNFKEAIDLGIPHGNLGIVLFLMKCCGLYGMHDHLFPTIQGFMNWLLNKLDNESNSLNFIYSDKHSTKHKLAWCYGNLAICFALLRFDQIFNDDRCKKKAFEILYGIDPNPVVETRFKYFSTYEFFDLGICHGLCSAAYLFQKMFEITKDQELNIKSQKWFVLVLQNLEKFLMQIDNIKRHKVMEVDTSMSLLTGLTGVGLTLNSFLVPELSNWDRILLLDSHSR